MGNLMIYEEKKRAFSKTSILLTVLLAAVAGGASTMLESDVKAQARADEMYKILLTMPKSDPAGQRIARPMTFKTNRFTLRFSATGVSVKRPCNVIIWFQLLVGFPGFMLKITMTPPLPSGVADGAWTPAGACGPKLKSPPAVIFSQFKSRGSLDTATILPTVVP